MRQFWRDLSARARAGLVVGAVLSLAATVLVAFWALRTDYQVLFADLAAQDAAAMTSELERLKIPFSIADQGSEGGTTILVDRKDVYRTRLKLMGKDLPLHGSVGFELFNNSDFGMTEFAQRVNYQRALQGELTRTILSLNEVRDVRVLLALPEQGLFKQARNRATASITLTLKPGRSLAPAQIVGLQRLVAAAVPGIAAEDVTITDQSGVALTRPSGDGDASGYSARLELKRDTEVYLSRKATEVLDRTLGAGQALASVDVTLDMDRVQTTIESIVTPPGGPGRAPTGVVVRERETVRELGAPLRGASASDANGGAMSGSSQREVEYAVGRRVDQVVAQPGSVKRLQVVAVVKQALDGTRREQVQRLLAASVGVVPERGDVVVVHSMAAIAAPANEESPASATARAGPGSEPSPAGVEGPVRPRLAIVAALTAAIVLAAAGLVALQRRRAVTARAALSEAERRAALARVQGWLRATDVTGGGER